jgi:hypothetical protein
MRPNTCLVLMHTHHMPWAQGIRPLTCACLLHAKCGLTHTPAMRCGQRAPTHPHLQHAANTHKACHVADAHLMLGAHNARPPTTRAHNTCPPTTHQTHMPTVCCGHIPAPARHTPNAHSACHVANAHLMPGTHNAHRTTKKKMDYKTELRDIGCARSNTKKYAGGHVYKITQN